MALQDDDLANDIALLQLTRKKQLGPLYEAPESNIGQTLADLGVGLGSAFMGQNGPQAIAQLQATRAAQRATTAKALDEGDLSKPILELAKQRSLEKREATKLAAQEKKSQELENRKDARLEKMLSSREGIADKRAASSSEREPKQNQYSAASYGQRLKDAEDVFTSLQNSGFDPTSISSTVYKNLPGVLEFAKPEATKLQQQAEDNFINAVLRRESGAAIQPSEYAAAARQYFPRPGDSEQVLAQKAQNRSTVRESLLAEGAPAANKIKERTGESRSSAVPAQADIDAELKRRGL